MVFIEMFQTILRFIIYLHIKYYKNDYINFIHHYGQPLRRTKKALPLLWKNNINL